MTLQEIHERNDRIFATVAVVLCLCVGACIGGGVVAYAEEPRFHGLVVAPEQRCAPYSPHDYPYNTDRAESSLWWHSGAVFGPYTDTVFASVHETDLEHMVARSEAHDSGACAWTPEQKRTSAMDPLNHTFSAPHINRVEKKGKDPAEWLPPKNACWFVGRVLAVKQKYELTIDPAEREAMQAVIDSCGHLPP